MLGEDESKLTQVTVTFRPSALKRQRFSSRARSFTFNKHKGKSSRSLLRAHTHYKCMQAVAYDVEKMKSPTAMRMTHFDCMIVILRVFVCGGERKK